MYNETKECPHCGLHKEVEKNENGFFMCVDCDKVRKETLRRLLNNNRKQNKGERDVN